MSYVEIITQFWYIGCRNRILRSKGVECGLVQQKEPMAQCMSHSGSNKLLLPLQDLHIGGYLPVSLLAVKMATALFVEPVQQPRHNDTAKLFKLKLHIRCLSVHILKSVCLTGW